jgi:hypothetical protein
MKSDTKWYVTDIFDEAHPFRKDLQSVLDRVRENRFDEAAYHVKRLAVLCVSAGFTKEVFNDMMRTLDLRLIQLAQPKQYQQYRESLQRAKKSALGPRDRAII